ncbi:uncharacterized protein LOC122699174 [Cervus elaphus]|uniref:uncharacterized protein LOC122699174 n=1 Tax=Cervus elaphus TaxID=9860 RepID=UPI001CC30C5F|nr:uncharacterized protein LOC122699174 [Cervus elaphus]
MLPPAASRVAAPRASPQQQFFVVLARRAPSFFPAFPGCSLPDLGCPARRALGTLAVPCSWAPEVCVASCRQPCGSPQPPRLLPSCHSWSRGQPRVPPRPRPGCLMPVPGCRPAPVVTCSLSRGPGTGAQRPGRQRAPLVQKCGTARAGSGRLGEKPCRCILFSKKIKYFHGKLSLCVFLPPPTSPVPFSWVVFQGQLLVFSPWRPHPAARAVALSLACLGLRPCRGWHAPACHLCSLCLTLSGRGRVRGWLSGCRSTVSHDGLSASWAFALSRRSHGSAHQASDTPWARLRHCALLGVPAASFYSPGRSEPQDGFQGPGSHPSPPPR